LSFFIFFFLVRIPFLRNEKILKENS
jgi:hypothetical protein